MVEFLISLSALIVLSVLILASGDSTSSARDYQAFRAKIDAVFSRGNLLSIVWAAGLILAAASTWHHAIKDEDRKTPVAESIYWAVQTMTTVGYGASLSECDAARYNLASIWMVTMTLYWAMVGTIAVDTLRS